MKKILLIAIGVLFLGFGQRVEKQDVWVKITPDNFDKVARYVQSSIISKSKQTNVLIAGAGIIKYRVQCGFCAYYEPCPIDGSCTFMFPPSCPASCYSGYFYCPACSAPAQLCSGLYYYQYCD